MSNKDEAGASDDDCSQPLFTENQDGGNDGFTDYSCEGTDDESLTQNTIIINKRKYVHEMTINENQETCGESSNPKMKKIEEPYDKVTDSDKECIHCVFDKELDKRNYYFGNLLIGELQFLPPCMRSHAYINILKYVETLKHKHYEKNNINLLHDH